MRQQTYTLNGAGIIQLKGYGNVRITGWDRPEVALDAGYGLSVEQIRDGLQIKSLESCEIFAPVGARLALERIDGDLHVANISGTINVGRVGGSATFFQVGPVQVGKVGADCRVKNAAGSFTVEKVGGAFEGSDFSAGFAGSAGGDLSALNVHGSFEGRAGGDIRLVLLDSEVRALNARAGGDIFVGLPPESRMRLEIANGAKDIQVDTGSRVQQMDAGYYNLTIGTEGGTNGHLRAGGRVRISDRQDSWQPGLESQFSELEDRISARIRSRLQAANVSTEASEWANRMAQEGLRRAQERISAAMQKMEARGFGSAIPRVPPMPPVPPIPPVPPQPFAQEPEIAAESEPLSQEVVTDEERLLILRMLQEKKITVEQAENLMEALESSTEE